MQMVAVTLSEMKAVGGFETVAGRVGPTLHQSLANTLQSMLLSVNPS